MTHVSHRSTRILAGLLVGLATVVCGCFGIYQLRQMAKERVAQTLEKLASHPQWPVSVETWQLGIQSLKMENITVGRQAEAAISNINIDVNLNPFVGSFGDLENITIDQLRVTTKKQDPQQWVSWLQNIVEGIAVDADDTPNPNQNAQSIWSKTQRIHLKSATVRFLDPYGREHYRVKGLSASLFPQKRSALFHVGYVSSPDKVLLRHLEGKLTQEDQVYQLSVESQQNDKNTFRFLAEVSRDLGKISLTTKAAQIPKFIEPYLRPYLAQQDQTRFFSKIDLQKVDHNQWSFAALGKARGIRLAHNLISRDVVGPFSAQFNVRGRFQPSDKTGIIEQSQVLIASPRGKRPSVARVFLQGGSRRSRQDGSLEIYGSARIPPTDCQALVLAPPPGFAPELQNLELSGQFGGQLAFNLPVERPEDLYYQATDYRFACQVKSMPEEMSRSYLEGDFLVSKEENGHQLHIPISSQSHAYTPLAALPPYVANAFTTSEDAGYWYHKGIDGNALDAALRRNVSDGRVALGGSTITMQTVKNLFLNHERTLSRKYQEMILAWFLNKTLSKERVLEIYVNLVEFGPGIYGITQAAEHYFDKSPTQLSLKESIFLANLLPSPVRRHRHFCMGAPGPGLETLMDGLLRRMLNLNRINYGSYVRALREPLYFNTITRQTTPACQDILGSGQGGAG